MSIHGGATMWARQTTESDVFREKPDKWFKIWFYIVNKVNHADNGKFKRGSGLIKYEWITTATGATKSQIDHFLRWSKGEKMLATQKATRGMFVSVLKYDTFQNLDNYRSDTESDLKATQKRHRSDTINNNEKNENNEKKKDFSKFEYLNDESFTVLWNDYLDMRKNQKKPATTKAKELALKELHKHDIGTASKMLEQSIMNSWQGVFPLREDPKNKFKNHNQIVLEKIQKLMVPTMAGKVPGKRYIMDWKYEDTDLLYISDSLSAIEQDNGGIVIERDVRIANDPKFLKTLDQWLYDYTRNS